MRISDWSSDVCSSDLLFRPSLRNPPSTIYRRTRFRSLTERPSDQLHRLYATLRSASDGSSVVIPSWRLDHPPRFRSRTETNARFAPAARRSLAYNTDRKSVASGKRVSVSVVIGGHRIITTNIQ